MNQQQAVEQLLRRGGSFKQSGLSGTRLSTIDHKAVIRSYETSIAIIDYNKEVVMLNIKKYSRTTSKHQNLIQREATRKGFKVEYLNPQDNKQDYMIWTRL